MNYFVQSIYVIIIAILVLHYSGKTSLVTRKVLELYNGKKGCLPLADVGNITLYYFKLRERAEPIRLLMEDNELQYQQILYQSEDWLLAKHEGISSGLLTFGQVPAIETTKGAKLVQSLAITHLLGRSVGLDCDCDEMHICEVIALGVEDTKSKLFEMLYNPEFSLADRQEYVRNTLPTWMTYWENLAPELIAPEKSYFVGDRLTWVDYLVFDMLENNIEFSQYNFGPGASPAAFPLTRYPKLFNFYKRFSNRPNLKHYLSSSRRLPFTVPNMPKS